MGQSTRVMAWTVTAALAAAVLLPACLNGRLPVTGIGSTEPVDPGLASTIGAKGREPALVTEKATFAAGCFWGVEAIFRRVEGVVATSVGYTGGHVENPSYKQICYTDTGHAEAIEIEFDPSKVTYDRLLEVFWANHDPTTVNRQGVDFGKQYRSVVFVHSPAQETAAKASKERLDKSGKLSDPVVTEIVPATKFWPAEEYHQRYLEKRGLANCHVK